MHFEVWHLILALTALVGSAVTAWVAIQRSVAALTQRIASLEKAVHNDAKDRADKLETRCDRQDERMAKIEERANTFVDDEEFRAYTGQTTSAVSKLTEMVGHLRGLLEGWGRGNR